MRGGVWGSGSLRSIFILSYNLHHITKHTVDSFFIFRFSLHFSFVAMDEKHDNRETLSHREDIAEDASTKGVSAEMHMPDSLRGLSEDEYKKVGRKATLKMDIVVFPPLMLMYILNYLDRNNIAAAKLANIQEDLSLSETEFQSCISILYAGYST